MVPSLLKLTRPHLCLCCGKFHSRSEAQTERTDEEPNQDVEETKGDEDPSSAVVGSETDYGDYRSANDSEGPKQCPQDLSVLKPYLMSCRRL